MPLILYRGTAHCEKLISPLFSHRIAVESPQFRQSVGDRLTSSSDGALGVPMRTPGRLGDDAVDNAKPHHVLGGDFHAGRRLLCLGGVTPEDRSGALR